MIRVVVMADDQELALVAEEIAARLSYLVPCDPEGITVCYRVDDEDHEIVVEPPAA